MPVNFQELRPQIQQAGKNAVQAAQARLERLAQARLLREKFSNDCDPLRQSLSSAREKNQALRCAIPLGEKLDSHIFPAPLKTGVVLLAADGSQINPDRHAPVEFGLINVGIVRLQPGFAQTPHEITHTRLMSPEEVNTPDGPLTEDIIALDRDLRERLALAELAAQEKGLVVTLTDGPLELYGEPKESREYRQKLIEYLDALKLLAQLGTVAGGYVDKPKADLVVRLLELSLLQPDEMERAGRLRRLFPVTDAALMEDILGPGERSAVFGIQSISAGRFKDELALHFFYMNVGKEGRPWLARVEIPGWVAGYPDALGTLHSVLLQQTQILGNKPYPYALHRAHEIAVVRMEEKQEITDMLSRELLQAGAGLGRASHKQSLKDQTGNRTRFTP